jgi:hypothetical protein
MATKRIGREEVIDAIVGDLISKTVIEFVGTEKDFPSYDIPWKRLKYMSPEESAKIHIKKMYGVDDEPALNKIVNLYQQRRWVKAQKLKDSLKP